MTPGEPLRESTLHAQRRAAKLYLEGVKLLEHAQSEAAFQPLAQAAKLAPENMVYRRAAELARQSAVTQLVERANQANVRGNADDAVSMLRRALELDPGSEQAAKQVEQMGAAAGALAPAEASGDLPATIARGPIHLEPAAGTQSFHLRGSTSQVAQQVFKAFGIDAEVHDSVPNKAIRLDMEGADFAQATEALGLVTHTFYEPLDSHRVVVALDTKQNHTDLERQQVETVYLPGLTAKDLTDVSNLAHNVFEVQQAVAEPSQGTLTVRAPTRTLAAFNRTISNLVDGRNQIDLNVKIIELSHISARETGTTFLQQTGVYNAYSEIASIISQNQSLVQQIISSGLVANGNTLANQIAILAILVASGQVTGTPFNQGFIPFGHGLSQSIATPGPVTLTLSLNSSDTRTLSDVHLRLGDDEDGTIMDGERYPIETASYSSATLSPAISAAATAAGYGALAQSQNIPQIQYENLGLTLKARPKVMRSEDIALSLDLKIEALAGPSLNGIPVLTSRQFTGVLTLVAGETAVMFSDLSRQESRILNGMPGISDIPGLQDISDIQLNQNVARLIVLVTPTIARETQPKGHSPMLVVNTTTPGSQ